MSDAAKRRAEACFAVARSTTFDAEREAAIERGTVIVTQAGLSLDDFDIPGRERRTVPKPPPSRYADDLFARPAAPRYYTSEETIDVLRRFNDHLREALDEAAYRASSGGEP